MTTAVSPKPTPPSASSSPTRVISEDITTNPADEENDEEEEDDEVASKETIETAVAARVSIEQYYKNLFRSLRERDERYLPFYLFILFID